jgi:uncharacterized protein involved in exopolysaccharide biosynthesis
MNMQAVVDERDAELPKRAEDIGLLDIAIALAKRKKLVLGFPFLVTAATVVVLLISPDIYTATARLMPPQQSQSSAAALLGALSGVPGGMSGSIGAALGLKNPNDLYVGILKGHTIADTLIERFDLKKLYETPTQVETRAALERMTAITAARDGLIVIEVDDDDPERAANIANAYVEELDRLTQRLAVSEAGQRRLFFERELKTTRERLAAAEMALKGTQEKTGLIQPEGQAKAVFDAFAAVHARIAAKEVEIASMQTFATESNPDLLRAREELSSLKTQAAKLEKTQGGRREGEILVPTTNVPAAGLEYVRRVRDVKYHETLFELLAKQFEIAKIDEAKDAAIIQLVDKAMPPDRKARPKRGVITAVAAVLSSSLAVVLALLCDASERASTDPVRAAKRAALLAYLRWGGGRRVSRT